MHYFVGLDVSMNETAICVVDQAGKILFEGSVVTDPEDIDSYLRKTGLPLEKIGLEASNLSIWLYRELSAKGYVVFCIETNHAKAAMAAQNVKTDKNDARGIAQMMRTGWYKPVHVKSEVSQKLKMILNNRKCLVNLRIAMESQIRGTLKIFGLKVGEISRQSYEKRVRELISTDGELDIAISPLLEVRALILERSRELEKLLMDAAKKDQVCRCLMSAPGVGPLTALLFKANIDDPTRFRRSKEVAVQLGLTPRKYASGEVDYNGRITKCGDGLLRNHLYEAAAVVLRNSSPKSELKTWGLQLSKRSGTKKARVAVARKLSVILHKMWVTGNKFESSYQAQSRIAA
jgi:transposase